VHGGENVTGVSHIVLAMKPVEAGFAENAVLHGVAGLNVDGCRIGMEKRTYTGSGISQQRYSDGRAGLTDGRGKDMAITVSGRWPANVILGHAEGCVLKGMKKVKPNEGNRVNPVGKQSDGKIQFSLKPEGYQKVSYTNDDGMEEMADWECVEGCPVRRFPTTKSGMLQGDYSGGGGDGIYSKFGVSRKDFTANSGSAARFFKQVSEMKEKEI